MSVMLTSGGAVGAAACSLRRPLHVRDSALRLQTCNGFFFYPHCHLFLIPDSPNDGGWPQITWQAMMRLVSLQPHILPKSFFYGPVIVEYDILTLVKEL